VMKKANKVEASFHSSELSNLRQICFDHSADLIEAAERSIEGNNGFPNIAYHLAILALEEIGKAGLLASREITRGKRSNTWLEKRMDDHAFKLLWAIWSPLRLDGPIDPSSFELARKFSRETHARRLDGLYVDYSTSKRGETPRSAVTKNQALELLSLAKTQLEIRSREGSPDLEIVDDLLIWFLDNASDSEQQKLLFSKPFILKLEEFGDDVRGWVEWSRSEFKRKKREEVEHLELELKRVVSETGTPKPKWKAKIKLATVSHSIRPKILTYWNKRFEVIQLSVFGKSKDGLMMEIDLDENVPISKIFSVGLAMSNLFVTSLNLGTAGFFWHDVSTKTNQLFDSVADLSSPNMKIHLNLDNRLADQWIEADQVNKERGVIPLEEKHLDHAMKCFLVFGRLDAESASNIFEQYLNGIILLSKCDIHFHAGASAKEHFEIALHNSLIRYDDWDGEKESLTLLLHRLFEAVIPNEEDRTHMFQSLEANTEKESDTLADAVSVKRICDLYLVMVANRIFNDEMDSEKLSSSL